MIEAVINSVQISSAIILSAVLIISGTFKVGKVRDTEETFSTLFEARFLRNRIIYILYPLIEILLGISLIVSNDFLWLISTILSFILFATLLFLVTRIVFKGKIASCNCFGSTQRITSKTIIRNVFFFLLSIALLSSPKSNIIIESYTANKNIFIASTTSAILVSIIAYLSQPSRDDRVEDSVTSAPKLMIPELQIVDIDGERKLLSDLVLGGPVLLLHVKTGCGSCTSIAKEFSDNQLIGDKVVIRMMETESFIDVNRSRIWDHDSTVATTLGLTVTPSALLLLADGSIPFNPVYGISNIRELIEQIKNIS